MKKTILIISIFAVCLIVGGILQFRRESKLNNTKEIKAIITYRDKYYTKGWDAVVEYTVDSVKFKTGLNCDCRDIEVGDTVLIKYAVEDPELAVMVDKYYMQKYRHLKGK